MKSNILKKISLINSLVLESRLFNSEKEIIRKFVDAGRKVLEADYGYAFKWNNSIGWFEFAYRDSRTPFTSQVPRKHGLTSKAFNQKSPYFIEDTSKIKRIRADAKPYMDAVVIIPIVYKEERYGTIDICYKSKHEFTDEEKVLCEYIGNNAAQAIIINRLHSNLQDFKNRMDRSLDAVFMFHPSSFKIEYVNMGAAKLLGFPQKELLQKSFFDLQQKMTKFQFRRSMMPLIFNKTESLTLETTILPKSGPSIPVELFLQLSKSLDGSRKFLCIVHDLTQHKKAEREAQRLLKQKDEFFNIASHELKTPVTAIKGFAQILYDQLKGGDKKTKYILERINSQADKLAHLTNDLMDVSRIDAGKIQFERNYIELGNLVGQALENLRVVVSPHPIIFKSDCQFWLYGDYERIERVVINLVVNAAKYSPPNAKIKVFIKKKNKMAHVEVEDYGYGIPIKNRTKIFKKFFQSKSSSKQNLPGLGLGLYIASSIIKKHGGQIGFKPKSRGNGTIFYFTLPFIRHQLTHK